MDPTDLLTSILKDIKLRLHQEDIIDGLTGSWISYKHGSIMESNCWSQFGTDGSTSSQSMRACVDAGTAGAPGRLLSRQNWLKNWPTWNNAHSTASSLI
jgi:hypothetical protein